MRRSPLILLAIASFSACGGGSPSSPSGLSPAGSLTYRGTTVNALDGAPLAGLTVRIGSQSAVSDANGNFQVEQIAEGDQTLIISGAAIVERQTTLRMPAAPGKESLIPRSFDLDAFDQMFRPSGRLQRWTSAPALVVLSKVMQYETFGTDDEYHATAEQLTTEEVETLIAQLTEGLGLLTGNTFTSFSSIDRETPATGARVSSIRAGKIVVGRYRGVQALANTIGFGRWATESSARVVGGAIYLDRDFDRSSEQRRLLRIHELGHALGYAHVMSSLSVMNPAIGPEPSAFDRQASTVAFLRSPGNMAPDSDLETGTRVPTGGIFGVAPTYSDITWSAPIP